MKQTDVVIVGGGLVGSATAYYLSKAGVRATVIEKGQLNRQASGQNAGSLHFQLEHRLVMYWEQLKEEMSELIPFSLESQTVWAQLEEELGADMEVVQHGGIMIAETKEEVEKLYLKYELEKKWGLETELISGDEARAIAPYLSDRIKAAAYCPAEGHANPRLVTPQFARKATELGAEFLTESSVTNLNYLDGKWVVEINREEIVIAPNVVIATGAWARDLGEMAGIHIPMYPVPLTMNVTEPVEPLVHHLIQHVGKRITLKQVRDGNILIGGGWSSKFVKTKGRVDYNQSPNILTENVIENIRIAAELVPVIEDLRLMRTWPGVTGVSIDQLPILGEFPERKGLYIGGGGSAFTFGPLYGQVISDLITTGKTDFSIKAFAPDKFSHLNMFMP